MLHELQVYNIMIYVCTSLYKFVRYALLPASEQTYIPTHHYYRIIGYIPYAVPLTPIGFCLGTKDNIDCFTAFPD